MLAKLKSHFDVIRREGTSSQSSEEEDTQSEIDEYIGPNTLLIFDRNSSTIQEFRPETDVWDTNAYGFSKEMKKWSFSATVLETALLIFFNNKTVYRYQSHDSQATWLKLPSMLINHGQYPPVVVLNGVLYVIGSAGLGLHTNHGERYNVPKRRWLQISNMKIPRRNHSLAATEDSIYSIGGQNKGKTLTSIEKYDPIQNSWSDATTLKQSRHSAAAIASGDDIFLIGGYVNGKRSSDMLCISTTNYMCVTLTHMNMTRTLFSAWIVDGKIFAVGGDSSRHDTVEVYDAENDTWEFMDILSTLQIEAAVSMRILK